VAGLVDHEALVLDLRHELRTATGPDGGQRNSWGRAQLLELLDELEGRHRVDEAADAATLRRFAGHLTDTFMGLVPRPATDIPLAADDRETSAPMDDSADMRSTQPRETHGEQHAGPHDDGR
jgi:hypothetical protein